MKYKNAQDILPDRLLKELQQYVSGETLYIPNAQEKKQWGETSGARSYYKQRNEQIREKHRCGIKIEALADEYNLSVDSIRKILY
ncbi:MAG: hypothetical protein J6A88_08925 [Oscillospiraceae bacterium]|jgi:Mor family transcriptional regulator|nr:hypothetical protein [Oscillospiraceae bacterium]